MFLGPIYIDAYNGTQYAFAAFGLVVMAVGAVFMFTLAVRAVLHRRFFGAVLVLATGIGVPTASASTPLLGPWLEQWIDWFVYGSSYGYGYRPSLLPDPAWLVYGIPISHGLGWMMLGVGLMMSAVAGHFLLPFDRFGGRNLDDVPGS